MGGAPRRNMCPSDKQSFTAADIAKHASKDDTWLTINREVFDVSKWGHKHPGGNTLISQWAGQDASGAFAAFHTEGRAATRASKILRTMKIGSMVPEYQVPAVEKEFEQLRQEVQAQGLFQPNHLFYLMQVLHIIAIDCAGFWVYRNYGASVLGFLASAAVLTVAQSQAGWLQHDLGHLSVFESTSANHWSHHFVIGFIKAASSAWWNFRHFQHHSKPNVVTKDPDINMGLLFLLGDEIPQRWAKAKRGFMPYNLQHKYWFLIGPPFLLPIYFHYDVIKYIVGRRKYMDVLMVFAAGARWLCMADATVLQVAALYLFTRFLESHWFTWVTQMNHLPMKIGWDKENSWVESQLVSTCNVEQSSFNDWFTGHLNFQIEHHLFPTMPRHNFHKVSARVEKLCQAHGLKYQEKTLLGAFSDIVGSLQSSGKLWCDALHLD